MKDSLYGELSVIGMRGCEDFTAEVDSFLKEWRRHDNDGTFTVDYESETFVGNFDLKGLEKDSEVIEKRKSVRKYADRPVEVWTEE